MRMGLEQSEKERVGCLECSLDFPEEPVMGDRVRKTGGESFPTRDMTRQWVMGM